MRDQTLASDILPKINSKFEQRKALLPAPQKSDRANVNQIVREYSVKNELDYSKAWGALYTEFNYRTNRDVRVCAKNRDMGILEYIESEGLTADLLAVAIEFCK